MKNIRTPIEWLVFHCQHLEQRIKTQQELEAYILTRTTSNEVAGVLNHIKAYGFAEIPGRPDETVFVALH